MTSNEQPNDPGVLPPNVEAEIRAGIEAAMRQQRAIDHRTAYLIAKQFADELGGSPDASSPLGRFMQTGEVLVERTASGVDTAGGLLDEIWSLIGWLPTEMQPWLEALASYALSREAEPGPVSDWQQLTGAVA